MVSIKTLGKYYLNMSDLAPYTDRRIQTSKEPLLITSFNPPVVYSFGIFCPTPQSNLPNSHRGWTLDPQPKIRVNVRNPFSSMSFAFESVERSIIGVFRTRFQIESAKAYIRR